MQKGLFWAVSRHGKKWRLSKNGKMKLSDALPSLWKNPGADRRNDKPDRS